MSSKLELIVSDARTQHLIGNTLCLDFANTLYGHSGNPIHEYLFSYDDLVVWGVHAGMLDPDTGERLLRAAERQPRQVRSVFHRALELREAIYRIFAALALEIPIQNSDLAALNTDRTAALAHTRILASSGRFISDWDDPLALDRVLWPVAISAGELLTSPDHTRVRQCSGETCDWLFVDTSRNHMRRWCQMRVCGNRAKARRFTRRHRSPSPR